MVNQSIKCVILIILDGWGYAPSWGGNAISEARTPNFDKLWRDYPHTTLHASGKWVGLSGNERGNSEVGHLNLGAGKIVLQDRSYINEQLTLEKLKKNKILNNLLAHVKKNNSSIHLMGLTSYGGIHSHIDHLVILLKYFSQFSEIKDRVFIHAFTDGRDSPTNEAISIFSKLKGIMKDLECGKIITVSGRYYAMDRDNHWERTEKVYDAITGGIGEVANSELSAISKAYTRGESDEFIKPTVIVNKDNQPLKTISSDDALIYFNFRSDRARQLSLAFAKKNFNKFRRKKIVTDLFFVNLVPYGIESDFETSGIYSFFKPEEDINSIAKIISENNLSQLHIAETEKYAHITYFFNGGIEKPYRGEDRILVSSPQVPTYDQRPEMSAPEVTKKLISACQKNNYDFVILNFANPDMVGHTGNYQATISACEIVDEEIGIIIKKLLDNETAIIITADHGNAEQMTNPRSGKADTEHTNNLVPLVIIKPKWYNIPYLKQDMKLANVAPTILKLLGIKIVEGMEEAVF